MRPLVAATAGLIARKVDLLSPLHQHCLLQQTLKQPRPLSCGPCWWHAAAQYIHNHGFALRLCSCGGATLSHDALSQRCCAADSPMCAACTIKLWHRACAPPTAPCCCATRAAGLNQRAHDYAFEPRLRSSDSAPLSSNASRWLANACCAHG